MSLSSIYRTDEDPTTPNLKSVMAKLAVMNPQQLQAFAAAHENDPIMLSAAQAVKNSHDQFMQHKMALQGGTPPPVNQQVVQNMAPRPQGMPPQGMPPQGPQGGPPQGMPPQGPQGGPPPQAMPPQGAPMPAGAAGGDVYDLPEDVGIGRLPTPNIARMADGGIAGFSDEEPVVRMADGGMVAFAGGGDVPRFNGDYGSVPQALPGGLGIYSQGVFGPQAGAPENLTWAQRKMDEIAAKVEAGTASPQEKAWLSMFGGAAKERASLRQQQALYQNAPNQMGGEMARLQAANKAAAPTTAVAPDGSQTTPDGGQRGAPPAAPAAQAAPGLPGLAGYKKDVESAIYKNAPTKEAFLQEVADIDKPVREKMQASIDKETERLKSDKEQDFFMSLMIGGAKAASGTSPYTFQNIADGVAAGAGNFKEALKDFRKATQENTKMEMELARYEATGKKDALKSYYSSQEKRDDRYAAALTSLSTQDLQNRGQLAAAGAKGQTERLIERIGTDPKFAAAYDKYATTTANARGDMAILQQYSGPKGEIALQMLEKGTPDQRAYAAQIRQQLKSVMVPAPLTKPTGEVRG